MEPTNVENYRLALKSEVLQRTLDGQLQVILEEASYLDPFPYIPSLILGPRLPWFSWQPIYTSQKFRL